MSRRISGLIAGWRTGLSGPVLILQAGNVLNYFGYGLILPFEIIYLHQIRGFSASTAGLVLAATMGSAALVTPPTGTLVDRYSAKAILIAGSLASALGYAGFAFVDTPWQAFACSIVSGAGIGLAGTANRVLIIRLVAREQRAASFALARVAGNFGLGLGASVAGFLVASAEQLGVPGIDVDHPVTLRMKGVRAHEFDVGWRQVGGRLEAERQCAIVRTVLRKRIELYQQ